MSLSPWNSAFSAKLNGLEYSLDVDVKCSDVSDGIFCISQKKDLLLNITIQERKSGDNLINYKNILKSKIVKAYEHVSKVKSIEKIFLNGRAWISSNHYESEFPKYSTQYYVSMKGDKVYLISISYKDGVLDEQSILKFSKSLKL
jgi:hypothetical protein